MFRAQPKTLLISEIEPGHRYELVCTVEAGLARYRMGDMINCTRFLCRADDLVPLPAEPVNIPRIPLISLAYRVGSLLDAFGEKTNEQHVMSALQAVVRQWKQYEISVDICDFTSYPKLDVFPAKYVIFLELIEDEERKIDAQQLQFIQNTLSSEVEQQLCKANEYYKDYRSDSKLDPIACILVRKGTFSTFMLSAAAKEVFDAKYKSQRIEDNDYSFIIDGKHYATVEHYYQSQKYVDECPEQAEAIRTAETALQAKDMSSQFKSIYPRSTSFDAEAVMLRGLRAKFTQNKQLMALLKATENKILREMPGKADSKWSNDQNMLGQLLMQIRDEL
ncbi:unnamed protein product [Rotaria sp. Silwood1]|nr:unnamed protein product [Rotaria sp. Silwood1]CAF4709905.1 unnamed protein product [Rotaria sp. Silwood1]